MEFDLATLHAVLKQTWTVWMLLIFAGIALYAFWPGNRAHFDRAARMPLDDDETGPVRRQVPDAVHRQVKD